MGLYQPDNREELEVIDPEGYALLPKFFAPYLSWMVMLSPTLMGTFSMTFDETLPYTWKSQYYMHATLLGSNDANLVGNGLDNCFGPNAGTNNMDGREGTDIVLFRANCSEYSISCDDSSCTVTDSQADRDGITTTVNVEHLSFEDGDFSEGSCSESKSDASLACWELVPEPAASMPEPTEDPDAGCSARFLGFCGKS